MSRLLTYFPHDYAANTDPVSMARDLSIRVPSLYGTDPKQHFGHGCISTELEYHGGGPTRTMLDAATRWMKPDVVYPNLQFTSATSFFSDLEKKTAEHANPCVERRKSNSDPCGVMTTQAETKSAFGKTEKKEFFPLNAEKFSSLAALYGRKYPAEDFDRGWKRRLFDVFHDIMPGSGIA